MAEVMTVRGPVDAASLGVTLSHEHLFLHSPGLPTQYPWLYDRDSAVQHVVAELVEAREAGVGAMIDVSTPDLGRDVELIRRASDGADLHVIAATGIWTDIPRWFNEASADDIAGVFRHEIEQGIAGSDMRAGVIKVANDDPPGVGEVQERVLRGAARAAAATGVAITTHTSPYGIGREQMRVFADEGLDPSRVAIGHAFTDDLDYLRDVLAAGHYLSIDTFAYAGGTAGEQGVLDAIASLCVDGHADHVMLSHDYVPEWDWRPHAPHTGPSTFTYVARSVVPALHERGVSAADVNSMLVGAPAAFLSGVHATEG